jgi:hypothetical protein
MANLALAPEEDDDFPLVKDSGSSSRTSDPRPVNVQRLHLDFESQTIGFGAASPWPGIEPVPNANSDNPEKLNKDGMKKEEQP